MKRRNVYTTIVEGIFHSKFRIGMREVGFERQDIVTVAKRLNVRLPKNLGDLIYRGADLPLPLKSIIN
jgi:hypothetical protein